MGFGGVSVESNEGGPWASSVHVIEERYVFKGEEKEKDKYRSYLSKEKAGTS